MSTVCDASSSCPIPSGAPQPQCCFSSSSSSLSHSYSESPGDSGFSFTPGGTRIIYDRKFLLECRGSPIAQTPPCCLPHIPGITMSSGQPLNKMSEEDKDHKDLPSDDNQFVLDI